MQYKYNEDRAKSVIKKYHNAFKTREKKQGDNSTYSKYYIRVAKGHDVNIAGKMVPQGAVYGRLNHWANGDIYFIIDDFAQFAQLQKDDCAKFKWWTKKQGEECFYPRTFDRFLNWYSVGAEGEYTIRDIFRFMDKNGITLHTNTIQFVSRAEQEAQERAEQARINRKLQEQRRVEKEWREELEYCRTDCIRKPHRNKFKYKPSGYEGPKLTYIESVESRTYVGKHQTLSYREG